MATRKKLLIGLVVVFAVLYVLRQSNALSDIITYFSPSGLLGIVATVAGALLFKTLDSVFEGQLTDLTKNWLTKHFFDRPFTNEQVAYQLDLLRAKVQNRCEDNLNWMQETDIQLIDRLNWQSERTKGGKPVYEGTLYEVIRASGQKPLQGVVVLGPPGVGKTFSIYRYILDVIADLTETRVPVFFSLSLWTKDQPLADWLQQELHKNYQVNRRVAQLLVDHNRILPVCDGLDQVSTDLRERCAERIIDYSAQRNRVVVSCRPEPFERIRQHLQGRTGLSIGTAFCIFRLNPLQLSQVLERLQRLAGSERLVEQVRRDLQFQGLAKLPMVLYILSIIRNQVNVDELTRTINSASTDDSAAESRNQPIYNVLWNEYYQHIFGWKQAKAAGSLPGKSARRYRYTPVTTRYWLQQLARAGEVSRVSDVVFIENLQPGYIDPAGAPGALTAYYLLSRIGCALLLSVASGLFLSGAFDFLAVGILSGTIVAGVTLLSRRLGWQRRLATLPYRLNQVLNVALFGAPVMVLLMLYTGFSAPRVEADMRLKGLFAVTEANVGLFISLFMGVLFGLKESWYKDGMDIKPVERIYPDWQQFFKFGLRGGLGLALFVAVLAYLSIRFFPESTFGVWTVEYTQRYDMGIVSLALLIGLGFGFPLIGVLGWLNQDKLANSLVDVQQRQESIDKPNNGIRRSVGNLLRGFAVVSLLLMLTMGLFAWLLTGELSCLGKGVWSGLGGGIMVALWFGGFDVIQHYVLRGVIAVWRCGPRNFLTFLDFATEMRFMRPTGPGYQFMHNTLYTYFKDQPVVPDTVLYLPAPWRRALRMGLLLLLTLPGWLLLWQRFLRPQFWTTRHGFEVVSLPGEVVRAGADRCVVRRSGLLRISAANAVYVGAFAGTVHAGGTEAGFLGMRIGDAYDDTLLRSAHHAALIVRQSGFRSGSNRLYSFQEDTLYRPPWEARQLTIPVRQGDTLQLLVNDREWQNNVGRFAVRMAYVANRPPEQIAHRAGAGLAPENSLEAVENALLRGIKRLEIDIRQTKDSVLVLMHDTDVKRTTNGQGDVGELTYQEVSRLTLRTDEFANYANVRIPTLKQVLTRLRGTGTKLLIEVKDPALYPGIDRRLAQLIRQMDMSEQVEIFSFDASFIRNMLRTCPQFTFGLLALGTYDYEEVPGVQVVSVHFINALINAEFLRGLRRKKYRVYVWTVNNPAVLKRLHEEDIDGILTDYPERYTGR